MKNILAFLSLLTLLFVRPVTAQEIRSLCVRVDSESQCIYTGTDLLFYTFDFRVNPSDFKTQLPMYPSEMQVNHSLKAGDSNRNPNASSARDYGAGIAYGLSAFVQHFQKLTFDQYMIDSNFAAINSRVDEINAKDSEEIRRAKNSIPSLKLENEQRRKELGDKLQQKQDEYSRLNEQLDDICERKIKCKNESGANVPEIHLERYKKNDFKLKNQLLSQKREELLKFENKKLSRSTLDNIYVTTGQIQIQANEAFNKNDVETASTGIDLATSLVNFGLDLVPVVSESKGVYEAIFGLNPFTGEKLSNSDRVISAVSATIGVVSAGTLGGLTKTALNSEKILLKIPGASKAFNGAVKVLSDVEKIGFKKVSEVKNFLATSIGKTWSKVRLTGEIATTYGTKKYGTEAIINNSLPGNGTYARVMPRKYAEAIQNGSGMFAGEYDEYGNLLNEAFITAADDLADINDYETLAKRLALYQDFNGSIPRVLGPDDVIVEFKFVDSFAETLRSPIQTTGGRGFGFLPNGKTAGGAREWLIDSDSALKGLIDLKSVKINPIIKD